MYRSQPAELKKTLCHTHGALDLSGTQVFGWFQLEKSVDDYNQLGPEARGQLIKWARDAAVTHGIDLSPFYSVVVCTNRWHDIRVVVNATCF